MEQDKLVVHAQERFQELLDKVTSMQARSEDLLFRAQRWANAIRNKTSYRDHMFQDDLQLLRRAVRTFIQECGSLPSLMDWLERDLEYTPDPRALERVRSLLKIATQFEKDISNFNDINRHLHHFVPLPELKVEVWYLVQEIEVIYDKVKGYPFFIAARLMLKVSTPEKGDEGPAGPKTPPGSPAGPQPDDTPPQAPPGSSSVA
ncbi:MAG: hypothetical protein HY924_13285 [Elusimicrobia bacterium]|nr:hypothetical protein [Elusimicrobiota bacterium]